LEHKGSLRVQNSPPLVPMLIQTNPVHTFPPYFPKIYSNIFLATHRSSEWYLHFRFSNMLHLSHPTWLDHPNSSDLMYCQ